MAHTDSSPHAGEALPASSKAVEQATLIGTLVHLWPYIWPTDRADLKMRVVWSVVLLLIAKLATLSVPFTFKWATDALAGKGSAPIEPSNWTMWVVASPLVMIASYGALRVLMAVLTVFFEISLFFLDLGSLRLQLDFRRFDLFLASLGVKHQFENLVLVAADFLLGELDLVEQSFVLLVGFYV